MDASNTDLPTFVADAYAAGQGYDDARRLVAAAGWQVTDETLTALWQALQQTDPTAAEVHDSTSGTGGDVPAEVVQMGWCWGGFSLGWVWGFANNVRLAKWLLALVLVRGLVKHAPLEWAWVSGLLWGVYLGGQIYLGLYGHRLAWQHRHFVSVQQFRETMAAWNAWGKWLFVGDLVLVAAGFAYYVATGQFKWH